MKIAMDTGVINMFERILRNNQVSKDKEEKALNEIKESGVRFIKLPSNIEYFNQNKSEEKFYTESQLHPCRKKELDDQKINERINELKDPYDDLEDECRLLAEAEEYGIDIILTTNGNFITELASKSNKVKIMKPTDFFKSTSTE